MCSRSERRTAVICGGKRKINNCVKKIIPSRTWMLIFFLLHLKERRPSLVSMKMHVRVSLFLHMAKRIRFPHTCGLFQFASSAPRLFYDFTPLPNDWRKLRVIILDSQFQTLTRGNALAFAWHFVCRCIFCQSLVWISRDFSLIKLSSSPLHCLPSQLYSDEIFSSEAAAPEQQETISGGSSP